MKAILLSLALTSCGDMCTDAYGICFNYMLLDVESVQHIVYAVEDEVNESYQLDLYVEGMATDYGLTVSWVSQREAQEHCARDGCIDEQDEITISRETWLDVVLAHELLHFVALHGVCMSYPWRCPGGAWEANRLHKVTGMFGREGDTVENRTLYRLGYGK